MMQSNLNPGQLARAPPKPVSLRTPRGARPNDPSNARLRDGQVIPRLPPKPEEAPPGEEEPWLFAFPRCLTTADLWKMGFAQAIMFNAAVWTSEVAAAAEISCALRRAVAFQGLSAEQREDLENAIAPIFLGGDVVITVACQGLDFLSTDDKERCVACMAVRARTCLPHLPPAATRQGQARARPPPSPPRNDACALQKLLDCISSTWSKYDEMEHDTLGAVVVVLEGCDLQAVSADWGDGGEPVVSAVTRLDESLAPHFA